MGSFSFWATSLGLPLLLLAVNVIARWSLRMHQSAAGDLILLLMVFDGVVILQTDDFGKFSLFLETANDLRAWFVIMLIINAVFWWVAVFKIEHNMSLSFDYATGKYTRSPVLAVIGYIVLSASAIFLDIIPFTIKSALI